MARDFIMAKVFRRRRSDGIEVDTRNPITSRIHKYCTPFDTINSLAAIYNDIMENQYQSAMLALSNSQPNNASKPITKVHQHRQGNKRKRAQILSIQT